MEKTTLRQEKILVRLEDLSPTSEECVQDIGSMLRDEVQGEKQDRFIQKVELETQRFVDHGWEGKAMLELAAKIDETGRLRTSGES